MAYNYTTAFWFEKAYNPAPGQRWLQENWTQSIYISAFYVVFVFAGQRLMVQKPAYKLTVPLFIWNVFLAVFNILGSIRSVPVGIWELINFGFVHTACDSSFTKNSVSTLWAHMFTTSKIVELVDTVFLVLRKRKVVFLHWYHHVTVFIYTWHSVKDWAAVGKWFGTVNLVVHSFMYTYYALRTCGITFSPCVPMTVTILQLSQMVIGLFVIGTAYVQLQMGKRCHNTTDNLHLAFLMYFTYLLLFAHFFYNAYFVTAKYQKRDTSARGVKVNNEGVSLAPRKARILNHKHVGDTAAIRKKKN